MIVNRECIYCVSAHLGLQKVGNGHMKDTKWWWPQHSTVCARALEIHICKSTQRSRLSDQSSLYLSGWIDSNLFRFCIAMLANLSSARELLNERLCCWKRLLFRPFETFEAYFLWIDRKLHILKLTYFNQLDEYFLMMSRLSAKSNTKKNCEAHIVNIWPHTLWIHSFSQLPKTL